jgi:hypothetical protein
MINQNLEHITQTGTEQAINLEAGNLTISEWQGYCLIFGLIIVLVTLILAIKDVIKNLTNRECLGCKRLKKVEKELEEIKKKDSLSDYWDKNAFNAISAKLDILIKEKKKYG